MKFIQCAVIGKSKRVFDIFIEENKDKLPEGIEYKFIDEIDKCRGRDFNIVIDSYDSHELDSLKYGNIFEALHRRIKPFRPNGL